MKNLLATLLVSVLLAGCGVSPARHSAYFQCVCPRGQPEMYVVSLTAPTGKWQISGHGLGLYESGRNYSLRLPEWPRTNVKYSAAEIALIETTSGSDVPVVISGGRVEMDLNNRVVVVALETPDGAFWANDEYPMRGL